MVQNRGRPAGGSKACRREGGEKSGRKQVVLPNWSKELVLERTGQNSLQCGATEDLRVRVSNHMGQVFLRVYTKKKLKETSKSTITMPPPSPDAAFPLFPRPL